MKKLFNDNFQFKKISYDEKFLDISYGLLDNGYTSVEIPHDAVIDDSRKLYDDNVIWYKKRLGINKEESKKYILYFEGVYIDTTIFINNKEIFKWVNGYTSFWVDITDHFESPEDELLVRISYRNPNARWYAGPGIFRNVWLYENENTHFIPDSLYFHAEQISDNKFNVDISWEINNPIDELGFLVSIEDLDIKRNSSNCSISFTVDNANLWDITNPFLYDLKIEAIYNDIVLDTYESKIGFRTINIDTEKGFFLNGRHIKLNGVCLHSDFGALGSAYDEEMAKRQITCMKDMGANAIRMAHNAPAPGFLDLCDEMGMLVMDESFDCWRGGKTTYDYGRFFDEWCDKDIASYIRRDRNHPCIIMWSAGNEIYDTHAGPEGKEILIHIRDEIKKHDPLGNAYITLCSNYMAWENTQKAVEAIKVVGYNYGERLYDDHHAEHPDWFIYGSETASCVQSRGIYHFPLEKSTLADDDCQCSSLGNSTTSWGAKNIDYCLSMERDREFSLGQFLWSGIDYLGEPTPYHTKNSYFGMADTACFPKDQYYIVRSGWTDPKEKPVIHIFPYWDFNVGQRINVRVTSNMQEVELFLNGRSCGKQKIDSITGFSYCADYVLNYENGEIKAVAYNSEGNIVCEAIENSFGDTDHLVLSETEFVIQTGDRKTRFVEVSAADIDNNPVRNANDRVEVSIEGPGKLIGIDNGDSTDYDSFKGDNKRLFSGKLLLIIKPTGEEGIIKVNAQIDTEDIPLRKLDLKPSNGYTLTPDNPVSEISAFAYPASSMINEIEWQITNESGISIQNIAICDRKADGSKITIKAVADAYFKVRALHREKDGRVTLISQIEMKAEGFGELFTDPYRFVSASLYTKSFGDIGNGNEKGIATSRTEATWVAYENIDFGDRGSKEFTIPIFEMDNQPTKITFWSGIPHEDGSKIICEDIYDKKSIWNVYQEQTFYLKETLTGIKTIGVELHSQKIHMKGFIFKKYNPAYEVNFANKSDEIYGDTFSLNDRSVTGIGNNVSLVYHEFDFGDTGLSKVYINGHTDLSKNTIHIRFKDTDGNESRQIVEFNRSEDYEVQCFELENIKGINDVVFLFLPGSNFDFKEFRFE